MKIIKFADQKRSRKDLELEIDELRTQTLDYMQENRELQNKLYSLAELNRDLIKKNAALEAQNRALQDELINIIQTKCDGCEQRLFKPVITIHGDNDLSDQLDTLNKIPLMERFVSLKLNVKIEKLERINKAHKDQVAMIKSKLDAAIDIIENY